MIIYSEITKQKYNSVEECKAAEEAYAAKKREEEKAAKKLEEERKLRAEEVDKALEEVKIAIDKYNQLKQAFLKDYKNKTIVLKNCDLSSFFENLFNF